MDVLLLTTPFYPLNYSEIRELPLHRQERTSVTPPLGVGYLASYLTQRGYRVKIIDLDLEIFTWIKERGGYNILDIFGLIRNFDIIGISCFCSARYKQAQELAKICRGIGSTVVMGGNYPTNSPIEALQYCDYVVLGEGEETFYKLLRALEEGVGLEEIDGIAYGETVIPKKSWISDLDSLAFPEYNNPHRYHALEMSQGLERDRRFFTLFTSRGCPHRCSFCGAHNIFGREYRKRSVSNVLQEVDWLISEYNATELIIQDDNFTSDRKRCEEILEGLSLRGISWCVPNGVEANTLDRSLLEKMRDSGCSDLSIAVETASSRIQKLIHKFVDLEKVKQTIRDMRELGIYSKVFFMVGFPGETKEDIQETIDFASELKADWSSLSIVNPLPGTEIGERVKIDYRDIGYANANIQTEDFTPQEIEKIVQEANTRINFIENPNKIFNRDIAIRDFRRIAERYPNHLVARRELENLYNR